MSEMIRKLGELLDLSGVKVTFDPYRVDTIERVIDAWLPYVFAINNVNRAMGARDVYPFVLSPTVIRKLGFIHDLVHGRLASAVGTAPTETAPEQGSRRGLAAYLPWRRKAG